MQEKFEKVLSGETKIETLLAEEVIEFHKFISSASQEKLKEYQGIKEARQAEEKKLKEAQELAEKKEKEKIEKEKLENQEKNRAIPPGEVKKDERMDQFRSEQVAKAKEKLFSIIKVSDDEKKIIEEKFERLDTGKLDADFIYKDLLSAVAAAKPDEYINALNEKRKMESEAENFNANEAGAPPNSNPSGDKPKFSDEVMGLSKKAGITPEAAQRQIKEGNKRILD